jgi:hypothetical protein
MKFHLRPRDLSWPSGFSRKIGRENPDEHRADRGEANETGNGDTGADPSAPTPRRHRSTEEDRQQQEGERCRRPLPEPAIDPLDHPAQRRAVHRAGPTIATRKRGRCTRQPLPPVLQQDCQHSTAKDRPEGRQEPLEDKRIRRHAARYREIGFPRKRPRGPQSTGRARIRADGGEQSARPMLAAATPERT